MGTKEWPVLADKPSPHFLMPGLGCANADIKAACEAQSFVNTVAQFVAEMLPATHVFVSELLNAKSGFCYRATVGFENGHPGSSHEQINPEQAATMSHLSKDIHIIGERRDKLVSRVSSMLGGLEIHYGASVPILHGGKPWGVFGAYSNTEQKFDESKIYWLRTMAKQIAGLVQYSSHRENNIATAKHEWEATVDSLSQLVIVLDKEFRIVRANRTLEAWGYGEVAQVRGRHITDFLKSINNFADSTLGIDWPNARSQLAAEGLMEWELDQRPWGRVFQLSLRAISANPCRHSNAEGCYAVLVIDDVTKLKTEKAKLYKHTTKLEVMVWTQTAELQKTNKRLQHELLESERAKALVVLSEERYASLVESTLAGICIVSDGKISYCNRRFSEIFKYSNQELFKKMFLELIYPEDRSIAECRFAETWKQTGGFKDQISIRATDKSGKLIWLNFSLSLRDKNIESVILVNVVDITTQKNVELSLRDSEKQLRLLSCQLIDAQEMERKRIAAELHDGIGQIMGVIKYQVESIMVDSGNSSRQLHSDQLEKVVKNIRSAMDEVRKISMDLRPSILDDLGVVQTINWFCREFQNTYTGIRIAKRITVDESSIIEDRKLVIYRIIQEAMNNVVKHANATVIELALTGREDGIHLRINDNGQGFDIACVPRDTCSQGFGLRSMRERAELTGGIFSIESDVGEGTSIQVFWPEPASSICLLRD